MSRKERHRGGVCMGRETVKDGSGRAKSSGAEPQVSSESCEPPPCLLFALLLCFQPGFSS